MISERVRISDRFRSEGQGERADILGQMERELQRIQSEAFREAEEIRGRADAEAADIYARAYDQSPDARRFYEFTKSMETLKQTVDEGTWLLLTTDGDFFRFLESSDQ
jgi:membrane protease subunit HflC